MRFNLGIAVNGDENIARTLPETGMKGAPLTLVSGQTDGCDAVGHFPHRLLNPEPRVVLAAVVNNDNFQSFSGIVAFGNASKSVQHLAPFIIGRHNHAAGGQFFVRTQGRRTIFHKQYHAPDQRQNKYDQSGLEGDEQNSSPRVGKKHGFTAFLH